MQVCLDARARDVSLGGARQVLVGLASGFSRLDGDDRYLFLSYPESTFLSEHLAGPCEPVHVADPRSSAVVRTAKRSRVVRHLLERSLEYRARRPWSMPAAPPEAGRAGADVFHFLLADAFRTEKPSIYQLHDLQYLHLPELFSPAVRALREQRDRAFCDQAHTVAVMSQWAREDVVAQLGVPREKVAVVPWASVLDAYGGLDAEAAATTRKRAGVPDRFVLYPAQTWPHKNHLRLLTALAVLRDRDGVHVPLVLTGARTRHHDVVRRRIEELRLQSQVHDLGFVDGATLSALYAGAAAVVFPSLFEGFGMPVVEALASGAALACSDVCNLPELTQGAALLFDPRSEEEIATAVARLWLDDALSAELAERGQARAADFSWAGTARVLRALYRRAAHMTPDEDDVALLASA